MILDYVTRLTAASKMASKAKKEDPRLKNLRIKTGVLKRLVKEKAMYEKEAANQELRIAKMKEEGKDEHDIRKQGEVLQESLNMIPDCQRRIQTAYTDLQLLMGEDWSGVTDSEQYKAAQALLEEHKELASS